MPVMERTPPDAPLLLVDLAALVRVEEVQRLLEARLVEQEHQVVVSAVADEFNHLLRTARSVKRSFGCSFVCVCS